MLGVPSKRIIEPSKYRAQINARGAIIKDRTNMNAKSPKKNPQKIKKTKLLPNECKLNSIRQDVCDKSHIQYECFKIKTQEMKIQRVESPRNLCQPYKQVETRVKSCTISTRLTPTKGHEI